MATWKNSAGEEFEIKPVSPFLEEELRAAMIWPKPPYYQIKQIAPDGTEIVQTYQHTDDTMTEISPDPKNDPDLITTLPSPDGKLRRWTADSTPEERRAWRGYKARLAQAEQDYSMALAKQMVLEGVVSRPSDEWKAEYRKRLGSNMSEADVHYSYVLREVCASERDLNSLFLAIQQLRKISKDRVKMFEDSFRNLPEQSTAGEPQ